MRTERALTMAQTAERRDATKTMTVTTAPAVPMEVDAFRDEARSWLAANFERRAPSDRGPRPRGADHKTPAGVAQERQLQRKLAEGGLAGISYPQEYGGRGLTLAHERAFFEEARAYVLPDFGIVGRTTSICARTMLRHASADFLRRHIPAIISGDELWVQFFSEPEAGSDLAGVRTTAVRRGDHWVVNGAKIWSSGAYYADYGLCLTRTNMDVPKHRGLTWFAMPTQATGVIVQPITEINGEAEFCQEFFDDVELTNDDVVGGVDDGWTVAQSMLVFERGAGNGAQIARMPNSDLAPDLVALAKQAGTEKDPVVRQLIARAHINEFAREELGVRVAALLSQGLNTGVAAYGKLAQGTLRPIRAKIALQIGGAHALLWEHGDISAQSPALELLNGRVSAIAGGTNEMQRNGIGERVLGLAREPSFDTRRPFGEVIRTARNWNGQVG